MLVMFIVLINQSLRILLETLKHSFPAKGILALRNKECLFFSLCRKLFLLGKKFRFKLFYSYKRLSFSFFVFWFFLIRRKITLVLYLNTDYHLLIHYSIVTFYLDEHYFTFLIVALWLASLKCFQ